MRVWRITRQVYDPLDGEGPRRIGGRWNSPGNSVVYTASHLSLALVEVLVHTDPDLIPEDLTVFQLDVPDSARIQVIRVDDLPAAWARIPNPVACREVGDAWLSRGESLVLAVPSAVVPEEFNYLINPAHPAASGVRVVAQRPFAFDPRLL
ncbi:MAG TPA: RES family NAD+ phosphorylase [Longimicrobium sp.]|nr:RES family NAD+ phosphorylase [Longimicrobium sp.]